MPSEEELDSAQADLEIAEAGLQQAQETRELAVLDVRRIKAQLSRRQIRTPVDCRVIRLEKDEGEYVAALEPVVAKIAQLDKLKIKFFVDTVHARSLAAGDPVSIVFSKSGQQTSATIEFVSPVTDADSRTVRVEVAIKNTNGQYRSGVPVRLLPLPADQQLVLRREVGYSTKSRVAN